MKRMICAILVIVLLISIMPLASGQQVLDPRLEALRQQYLELSKEKLAIENKMIRLEGQFIERQQMIAEQKKEAEALEAEAPVGAALESEAAE